MNQSSEFRVDNAYPYNRSSSLRWVVSHAWRYPRFVLITLVCFVGAWLAFGQAQVQIGRAADVILDPHSGRSLLDVALTILGLFALDGVCILCGSYAAENIAARLEADAREELYVSLLGKSQTFHDRQHAGDIMARATDDTNQLSNMIVPGSTLLFESLMGMIVPIAYIGLVRWNLLLVPLCFLAVYIVAVRRYIARIGPVIREQRAQFGRMNAALEETVSGIEVVKATGREAFERVKFGRNARQFRNLFVQQGSIEARYLPLLLHGIALGLTFLHTMLLYQQSRISIGEIISVMSLMTVLRFPTFISYFAFSTVQLGIAGAERILAIIRAETDLDENSNGYAQPISGAIRFENVRFGYNHQPPPTAQRPPTTPELPDTSVVSGQSSVVLEDISFDIAPGQTVAIVGQTGSGKTALTQLVNRTYDVTHGRVLIDGIDVREWSLGALRSQISKIEQDVFLFSRSIRENIAFGAPNATTDQVEQAARAAQAHEFILAQPDGYDTVVGERGVTLSGGQRQRIALARAFLSNPRILILDDSTSAIDSATEDQIQRALREAQRGRTTLLITHRISQIRWADLILVLDQGRIVAHGTHDALLRHSTHYRRIFARYTAELPPLEAANNGEPTLAVVDNVAS